MEHLQTVRELLGGTKVIGKPKSESDFIALIRDGFPIESLRTIRNKIRIGDDRLFRALRIASRTASRRLADSTDRSKLKPKESELVLRLAQTIAMASDLLGSRKSAINWILQTNRSLGNQSPLDLLDTGIGFKQVIDSLERIEYGVFS